ncbi:MAG: DNA-binding NtrC family response regulator [Cognaticolwellia sp.]|jgi:DNA-binding NtrC family response regulator
MASVILASADDGILEELESQLMRANRAHSRATSWDELLRQVCGSQTQLVLVDGSLPSLDPLLLSQLAASLEHKPELRSVGAAAPPLKPARKLPLLLTRLRSERVQSGEHARELRLLGLGRDTAMVLGQAARAALPIYLSGERGSGKKRIARRVHARSGRDGPILEHTLGASLKLEGSPGTVLVESPQLDAFGALIELATTCEASGWQLITTSRRRPPPVLATWRHLQLIPLRERQDELRSLALLYLERHRRRMRLPRRRFDRALWALMRRHRWSRNAQELEAFVVQALLATQDAVIAAAALNPRVRELVEPQADAELQAHTEGFEELVEQRLRPVVEQLEQRTGLGLYKLVIEATERALVRLALSRTGGDQKAAAKLLGVARNTLHSKAVRLGLRQ